jgi:FkbM family methyltransferase
MLANDGEGRPRMKLLSQQPGDTHVLCEIRVRTAGTHVDLWVRDHTTDLDLLCMILGSQSMYALPASVNPKVIFDVGGNIGVASIYFALRYPEAKIYTFEPLPDNLELLRRNIEPFDNIHLLPVGLSDRTATLTYHMSNNPDSFGGGTFCAVGHDPSRAIELPVRKVASVIEDLGVDHVDVFKIDTEGSEYPVLQGIPEHILTGAQAYIGELHGIDDWAFCQKLSQTHQVGVDKRFNARCFPFLAVRKDLATSQALASAA